MQKMNKILKKLFPREKEVMRSSKKINKPWVMQYSWLSEELFRKHSFMSKYSLEWQDHYDNYLSMEHAFQMLEKEMRSYFNSKWEGRRIRLYNKQTKESIPLKVEGTRIKIDD